MSALEAGQRAYDSALATDSISDQLSQLSTDLTAVRTDQLSQEYPEYQRRGNIVVRLAITYAKEEISKSSSSLQRARILRESLPETEVKRTDKPAKLLTQEYLKIRDEFDHFPFPVSRQTSAEPGDYGAELHKFTVFVDSVASLWNAIDKFEGELLTKVSREAHKETRRLNTFTYVSYFLYPVGVLIGVLGQLAGVKSADRE